MIVINGWEKLHNIFPVVEDVSVEYAIIVKNPTIDDMMGLRVRPKVVYTSRINIQISDGIFRGVDVIVFPLGRDGKLQMGMGKSLKECQIVTPLPTHSLKSTQTFLEFVKNTFNSSLKLTL